jgi:hypothetical protein
MTATSYESFKPDFEPFYTAETDRNPAFPHETTHRVDVHWHDGTTEVCSEHNTRREAEKHADGHNYESERIFYGLSI